MVASDVRIARHRAPVEVSSEQEGHVMHLATRAAPALMLIGHRGQAVKQVCSLPLSVREMSYAHYIANSDFAGERQDRRPHRHREA